MTWVFMAGYRAGYPSENLLGLGQSTTDSQQTLPWSIQGTDFQVLSRARVSSYDEEGERERKADKSTITTNTLSQI